MNYQSPLYQYSDPATWQYLLSLLPWVIGAGCGMGAIYSLLSRAFGKH